MKKTFEGTIEIVLHRKIKAEEKDMADAIKEIERAINSTQWSNFFTAVAEVKSVTLKHVYSPDTL